MVTLKEQHEQAVGDQLIKFLNQKFNRKFAFKNRPQQAPDLLYEDSTAKEELGLEIVGAYYDESDAKVKWENARGKADAPASWAGKDFDKSLIEEINRSISEKCKKKYGLNCILLVYIQPALTTIDDIAERLSEVLLPKNNPFPQVFLAGNFPQSQSCKENGWKCFSLVRNSMFSDDSL